MLFDKEQMLNIIREFLANRLNCNKNDFVSDDVIFVLSSPAPDKQRPFLEITTMGNGIIVSADADILPKVRKLIEGKSREEIFEFPFIYGQSIYYIPDMKILKEQTFDKQFEYFMKEENEVQELYSMNNIDKFDNSIVFDNNSYTSTKLVLYAVHDGDIIALAGSSCYHEIIWELGIDVLPEYREYGLATTLIRTCSMSRFRWIFERIFRYARKR